MEFDKSRIYTAVNADELPIGSICIFANTLGGLRTYVECDCAKCTLKVVADEHEEARFGNEQDLFWCLAYLIEPPAEPKYEPFSDIEKTFEIIKKHGGWVKEKTNGDLQLVSHIGKITDGMLSISCWTSETLLENFVFADDGSTCGVPVEE